MTTTKTTQNEIKLNNMKSILQKKLEKIEQAQKFQKEQEQKKQKEQINNLKNLLPDFVEYGERDKSAYKSGVKSNLKVNALKTFIGCNLEQGVYSTKLASCNIEGVVYLLQAIQFLQKYDQENALDCQVAIKLNWTDEVLKNRDRYILNTAGYDGIGVTCNLPQLEIAPKEKYNDICIYEDSMFTSCDMV